MAGQGSKLASGWLELTVSTAGAQGQIQNAIVPQAEATGKEAGSKLGGGILASVGKIAGPLAAAAGIGTILKTGFDELKDAEGITSQLAAGLASTNGAAGTTVEQMNDLAASIQGYSGQTDDSIAKTQSLLLTFTNIKNQGPDKIFDQATVAAADMAARMGTDASSAAVQLGKALNDPVAGIAALTRVGVQFTDQQKAQIESMVAAGDTLGAQKIILAELQTQFGGSAQAFGDSFPGQVERVKRSFEDLTQGAMAAFLPVLQPALEGAIGLFKLLQPVIESVGGVLQQVFSSVGSTVGPIFAQIGSAFGDTFSQLADTLGPLATQFATLMSSASPLAILFQALQPVIPQLVAAVQGLVTAVGGALASAFQAIMPAVTQIVSVLGGVFSTVLQALLPVIVQIASVLGPILGSVLTALAPVIALIAQVFGQILAAVAPLIGPLLQLVVPIVELIAPLAQLVGALLPPIIQLFVALLQPILELISPLISLLVPALVLVADTLGVVIGWITEAISWFVRLVTGNQEAGAQFQAVWSGIMGFFSGIGQFFANIWNGLIAGFRNGFNQIISFFQGLPGAITGLLSGAGSWLLGVGQDIISGIRKGISNAWSNLVSWFQGLFGDLIGIAKKILGIASPSKVFASIGEDTIAGYVVGVEGMTGAAHAAITDALAPPGVGSSATGATGVGVVINNNITTPPNEDPRIIGRGIGRELVSQLAGVP